MTTDSNNVFNVLVQTKHGQMLINRYDQYVGSSLLKYGEFSEGESSLFSQLISPGDIVLEAGANIGAHTLLLSKLAGDRGMVFAFEPQRIVFQTLCANLALNQCLNVVAKQQGLGMHMGEMFLTPCDYKLLNNFGGLSLMIEGKGESVEITTIDSLGLTQCKLIKADVEGMEVEVLRGAINTIRRYRPMLYLENDREDKSAKLLQMLIDLDYRLWWHITPLFNPENFAGCNENIFGNTVSINVFCQPVESARSVTGLKEIIDPNDCWKTILP